MPSLLLDGADFIQMPSVTWHPGSSRLPKQLGLRDDVHSSLLTRTLREMVLPFKGVVVKSCYMLAAGGI